MKLFVKKVSAKGFQKCKFLLASLILKYIKDISPFFFFVRLINPRT